MRFCTSKEIVMRVGLAIILNLSVMPTLYAQTSTPSTGTALANGPFPAVTPAGPVSCNGTNCLPSILQGVNTILGFINNVPTYLNNIVVPFMNNLTSADTSDSTSTIQSGLVTIGQTFNGNYTNQMTYQNQLLAYLLDQSSVGTHNPKPNPSTEGTQIFAAVPNINDLSYSSFLNQPPVKPTGGGTFTPSLNFVGYASGSNTTHLIPQTQAWAGSPNTKLEYQNYFNTVVAIKSFDNYVLSNLYADALNAQKASSSNPTDITANLQNNLINQVANSNWLSQVAGEEIGKVIRQILIFESQSYVLLSELVQTQKQLLTATVMTNTLLMLNNRPQENYMAAQAQKHAVQQ